MAGLPPPRSKITDYDSTLGYAPAPLDEISSINGLLKYCHDHQGVESDFVPYAYAVLDSFFPQLSKHSVLTSRQEVLDIMSDGDHGNKSSGYPYSQQGMPTKKSVVEKKGDLDVLAHVLVGALKDELRPVGKDARLFRMASAALFAEGVRLFNHQNEYLCDNLFMHPLFVKFCTPGPDLSTLYSLLREFGPCCDADGSRWDANINLTLVNIVASWRARFLPEQDVKRYYEQVYFGATLFGGHLWRLYGQASGHVNTSTDNSLVNVLAMAYHAWSSRMTVHEFLSEVRFFVCGDDLIWSDRSGRFGPLDVAGSYGRLGMSLELGSVNMVDVMNCTFVATHPVEGPYGLTYTYDKSSMLASLRCRKRGETSDMTFQKVVQIRNYLFYHPDRAEIDTYVRFLRDKLEVMSPGAISANHAFENDYVVHNLYLRV